MLHLVSNNSETIHRMKLYKTGDGEPFNPSTDAYTLFIQQLSDGRPSTLQILQGMYGSVQMWNGCTRIPDQKILIIE